MTATTVPPLTAARKRRPSPYRRLVITEALLLAREIIPLLWGAGLPLILLVVTGLASDGPDASLGGLTLVAAYEPVLIAFTLATFALQELPAALASDRERGVLRRLNATPVGAGRLLGAQLTVSLAVGLITTAGILVLGWLAFGVALPHQPAGFCLALALSAAAMLAVGLVVAALARTGRVAGATGTMLFLALMFFAGLWIPQAQMPAALRRVSTETPLGAAVAALQHSLYGQWPSLSGLALRAGYAAVAGLLAWRFFRWE